MIIADNMAKSQDKRNNYISKSNDEHEILTDISKTGKERNWKGKKEANLRFAKRLEKLNYSEKKVERVSTCADLLKFVKDPLKGLKLYQAYFCGNKLCPICDWRRSMKYSWQAKKILDRAIKLYPKARFIFLTLTIRNVPASVLKEVVKEINKSFHRLFRRKKVQKNMLGFIRALEVTYSDKHNNYHPHLHILVMVKPSYFNKKENYITQEEWTKMWEQSANLDYTPIVDVRAVKEKVARDDLKNDFSEDGIMKAVLETAKYPVKPFEFEKGKNGKVIKRSEEKVTQITGDILEGLHGIRQLGFGGILKDIRKELQLDDIENGDLVNTSDEKADPTTGEQVVAYWNYTKANYFIKQ